MTTIHCDAGDGRFELPLPQRLARPAMPWPEDYAARMLYHARPRHDAGPLPRVGVELERHGRVVVRCWRDSLEPPTPPAGVRSDTEVTRLYSTTRHEEIAFASHLLHEHGYDLVRVFDRTFADVYRRPS